MKKSRRILCVIGASTVLFLASCDLQLPPIDSVFGCQDGKHSLVMEDAVSPTCGSPGKSSGVSCSVCGEVLVAASVIPATNQHTAVLDPPVSPTCQD